MKCQRRVVFAAARPAPGSYPVIETAAAPHLNAKPDARAQAKPQFEAIAGNPQAERRIPPRQQPLFAYRDSSRVVELETYSSPSRGGAPQRAQSSHHASEAVRPAARRKSLNTNQASFDFGAPQRPNQAFTRDLDVRQSPLPVAPLVLRAMAAAFDAGIVAVMSALFLISARLLLGFWPLQARTMPYLVIAPVLIAILYKVLFTAFGQSTLGLQGAGLRLVSFDGHSPTPTQLMVRLFSGWLSLGSAAMGLLWAICDQENLTWHDLISQTYLTAIPEQVD